MFFNRELEQVYQLAVSDAVGSWNKCYIPCGFDSLIFSLQSVSRCLWHPKLNQILVGCSDGKAKVYFSPKYSLRYVYIVPGEELVLMTLILDLCL